jgi:hypothetical protein
MAEMWLAVKLIPAELKWTTWKSYRRVVRPFFRRWALQGAKP